MVFTQRQAELSCEHKELRIQLAHDANSATSAPVLRARLAVLPQGRLAQVTESHPVSDGILQQQPHVQQQETTYAWHKLEQTERVVQREIAATQLAASRVMQSTMDSATPALQHSRLRINET